MGMCRDGSETQVDMVKEMAEGLGGTGLRLEDFLGKAQTARLRAQELLSLYVKGVYVSEPPSVTLVNDSIREYNALIDKAVDVLRWLLIQRDACGFRTHRNVHIHYPIPEKIRLLSP